MNKAGETFGLLCFLSRRQAHGVFQRLQQVLPARETLGFFNQSVGTLNQYVGGFAGKHGITTGRLLSSLRGIVEFADAKLDYLAGFLDMSTNYFERTGVQSVARNVIARAARETA